MCVSAASFQIELDRPDIRENAITPVKVSGSLRWHSRDRRKEEILKILIFWSGLWGSYLSLKAAAGVKDMWYA